MQLPRDTRSLPVQAGILLVVFSASLINQLPVLIPAARPYLGPVGTSDVFSSIILFSAPFVFLGYSLATRGRHLKNGWFELLYGSIVIMNLASYFSKNGGFQPDHPILSSLGAFYVFMLVRNLPSRWLHENTLLLILIPVIPTIAEASHGLLQAVNGHLPVTASFLNYNFLAMFLAMSIPLTASQVLAGRRGPTYRVTAILLTLFLLFILLLTTSRTAVCGVLLAMGSALTVYFLPLLGEIWRRWRLPARIAAASAFLAACITGAYFIYAFRPLSIWGRALLVKIGTYIFSQNILTGIGFGEISNTLAKYQEEYFGLGRGNGLDQLLAGNPGAVTSIYLESAVESGILGLLLYIPFWFLILRMAFSLVSAPESRESRPAEHGCPYASLKTLGLRLLKGESNGMIRFGAGSALLLYMIMSFPYSPSRVIEVSIYFNYILGIAVFLFESPNPNGPESSQGMKK